MQSLTELGLMNTPAIISLPDLAVQLLIGAVLALLVRWQFVRFGSTLSNRAELGLVVSEITPDVAKLFGLKRMGGVVITMVEAGSYAEHAGVVRGEIINQVGSSVVRSLTDYVGAVRKVPKGQNVMLLLESQRGTRWITLRKR